MRLALARRAVAGLAILALGSAMGCGSACQDLGERICGCELSGTLRDSCRSAVKNQISSGAQQPSDSDQQRCQTLLGTCVGTPENDLCDFIRTPAGKTACGLAY